MYIGVDMGGTNIKLGLLSQSFEPIWLTSVKTESEKGSDVVMNNMVAGIQLLLDHESIDVNQITAIGVGVPGQMNIAQGLSIFSPNFVDWDNVSVVAILRQAFGVPVFMDNDVRVNLYGEWQFGAGQGFEDLVMVTLGTGLGAAAVVDGHMLYGQSDSAGELGHMNMVRHNGRPCACGSSGCFARYVSARGILWTVRDHLDAGETTVISEWTHDNRNQMTAQMVSEAFDANDELAQTVYAETSEMLGFGLANVINLYNPSRIIIGGGVAQAGERLIGPAREIAMTHSLEVAREHCEIVGADLGSKSGAYGAAYMGAIRLKAN